MQNRPVRGLIAALLVLYALLGGLRSDAGPGVNATFVSSYAWASDDRHFGGFSGIELSPDGRHFTALSDEGFWTRGTFTRDDKGRITAADIQPMERLRDGNGKPLRHSRADSEGLAIAADGTLYVSFEGPARIARHDALDGPATEVPVPREFAAFRSNRSLESLAIDGDGRLYTIPEDTLIRGADFPVYRLADDKWSLPFSIPRRGDFLPTGADFGPDGRLYLLERAFRGLAGFQSRVRAFTIDDASILAEAIVIDTPLGRHDNLEGIAVWRDDGGAIRLTMVSDDNYLFVLRNEVVEYRLAD